MKGEVQFPSSKVMASEPTSAYCANSTQIHIYELDEFWSAYLLYEIE